MSFEIRNKKTGKVIRVSKQEARKMVEDERTEWELFSSIPFQPSAIEINRRR